MNPIKVNTADILFVERDIEIPRHVGNEFLKRRDEPFLGRFL